MRRIVAATVAVVLIVSALALTGCDAFHDYNKDANAIIARVNTSMTTFQSLEASGKAAALQLETIQLTPRSAQQALNVTRGIRSTLAAEKSVLASAAADMAGIKALKVEPEMKRYADLEIAAIGEQVKVVDASIRLFTELDKIYTATAKRTGTSKLEEETMAGIEAIKGEIRTLTDAAAKAQAEAAAYFNSKVAK